MTAASTVVVVIITASTTIIILCFLPMLPAICLQHVLEALAGHLHSRRDRLWQASSLGCQGVAPFKDEDSLFGRSRDCQREVLRIRQKGLAM